MGFRRSLALRPVKSEKIETSWSNLSQNAATTQDIVIASAVQNPTAAGQVEIGDTIKWVYLEFNFSAETVTSTKIIHWQFLKNPNFAITFPSASLYDQSTKKHILKRGMEMLPKSVNTIIKRIIIIPIPPRMRRMGDLDRLVFRYVASSTETINACGIGIFRHLG